MDDKDLTDQVAVMVMLSMVGDAQRAGDVLQVIADSRPTGDMYPVCCAVADIGREVMLRMVSGSIPDGAFWRLFTAEDTRPGPLFARRFITAWANEDTAMCLALYRARESTPGHEIADSVCALVIHVAALAGS